MKPKSFYQSFTWVSIMLLAMGCIFLAVGIGMQLVPMSPEDISYYHNGIRQPSTEATLRSFRLIFLLCFGLIGAVLAAVGGILLVRWSIRRRRNQRLKQEGTRITAVVADYTPATVRVNHQYMTRLQCTYNTPGGKTYIFKSGYLRMDPVPYLHEGEITVYYERNNMKNYFVDVDGSIGLGSKVVEL